MSRANLEKRMTRAEAQLDGLAGVPARFDALDAQILQLDASIAAHTSAIVDELVLTRSQLREEIRAGDAALRETLREEIRTGDAALREEIRSGDEETRIQMRILHEEVLSRIALLGEALNGRMASPAPRRSGKGKRQ